jgi:hypothetical protein
MVTLVSAEEVHEVEVEPEISPVETMQWHYHVPCAGVRYYSFEPARPPVEESDPWALDELAIRT